MLDTHTSAAIFAAPTLTRLQVSKSNMHTGDPVLAPLASPGAGKGAVAAVVGEVQPGSSRVTFSEASSSLLLQQQDTTLQSVSGSGEPAASPGAMPFACYLPKAAVKRAFDSSAS